jgi:hypothetical protein
MAGVISGLVQQLFRLGDALVQRPAGVIRVLQLHAADIRLADEPRRALPLP